VSRRTRTVPVAALLLATAFIGMGCATDESTAVTTTTTSRSSHDDVIEVDAVDFAFRNLPRTVPAGTRLALTNSAGAELHELVAIRLADEERRPADELMHLPQAELGAVLAASPPAAVLLAAPGAPQVAAVGDGTLREPGRYLVFCSIPTGVDPDVYLQAAAAAHGEQPHVDGGPPHFAHGMFAELTVE
jgi:hypothetical protein